MKIDSISTVSTNGNNVTARKLSDVTSVSEPQEDNLTKAKETLKDTIKELSKEASKENTKGLSNEKLDKALKVANDAFQEVNIGFRYLVDKKINREVVEIYNIKTGEKIRQYPPEEIINMLSRMYDMLGIIVDTKI